MNEEGNVYKSEALASRWMVFACLASLILYFTSAAYWKENRKKAVCYPAKVEYNYPWVHFMPAISRPNNEAKLYDFVRRYIGLTQDRYAEQFRKRNDPRYKYNATSDALLQATFYSDGKEKARIMKEFANSGEYFRRIKRFGTSYRFNIEAIESVQTFEGSGSAYITVLGEFQADSEELPPELWGFRRLHYFVVQKEPMKDTKDRLVNSEGLYVVDSYEERISQAEHDRLIENVFQTHYPVE